MGKSFHHNIHRRQRWPKSRRKRERRRIRSRNRQLKDKTYFTDFVRKTWPCVFENHSTVPNMESDMSLDELTSFTLLELGNAVTRRYVSSKVKCMTTLERLDESIDVITTILEEVSETRDLYKDMLNVLKFLASCKKQLLRRGAVTAFKGHRSRPIIHDSVNKTPCDMTSHDSSSDTTPHVDSSSDTKPLDRSSLPPLHPNTPSHMLKVNTASIPEPPPLPTQEQLSGSRKKVAITCKIGVPSSDDVQSNPPSVQKSHDEKQDEKSDESWSCSIM